MVSVGYLAIGNELLDGRVSNSNHDYLSTQFSDIGASVKSSLIVSDDYDDIKNGLNYFKDSVDILMITGGLGPTEDDRTTAVISEYLDLKLVLDEESLTHIQSFFLQRQRPFFESNRKQAYFPNSSVIIPNKKGTAPGFRVELGQTICFVLPGVSREMKPMFQLFCLPFIINNYEIEAPKIKTWNTFGLGESEIQDRLVSIYPLPKGVHLSYRAHFPEVHLQLRFEGQGFSNELIRKIDSCIADHVIPESLLEAVTKKLITQKMTISTAESCTGGLLSSLLTSISGSSEYFKQSFVTYSNNSKTELLGVPVTTLESFGAVSSETVESMVSCLSKVTGADYGVAISGIAGPNGGTELKPVGTVFIAIKCPKKIKVYHHVLTGTREQVRVKAVYHSLNHIFKNH